MAVSSLAIAHVHCLSFTLDQIFPQNIRDDIRLCGRKAELDTIAETFLGKNVEEQKGKEIPNFCVQVIMLTNEQDLCCVVLKEITVNIIM